MSANKWAPEVPAETSLDEIERWVLLLGINATVLEPPALVKRMAEITRTLAERYERMLNKG